MPKRVTKGYRLRLDPWAPEYEGALGLVEDEAAAARVELDVEPTAWGTLAPRIPPPAQILFVDGVRRIEHRLHVEHDGRVLHGLLGSYGVGAVAAAGRASLAHVETRRIACVGGGLGIEAVELGIGGVALRFEPEAVAENTPVAALQGLQAAMRRAEAALGEALGPDAGLVVLDGPLSYVERVAGPVLGLVKRLLQRYLPAEREALLPSLQPGERTPLFLIQDPAARRPRYSCYLRLAYGRAIESPLAGLVRLEIPGAMGLARAREVADLGAVALPRFASDPVRDPRAPQNLYPVGGLEAELRRRLGDPLVIRRAIEAMLSEEAIA
jgi:hypothetical protein